jgi:hypothetical protein
MSTLQRLTDWGLVKPPRWLREAREPTGNGISSQHAAGRADRQLRLERHAGAVEDTAHEAIRTKRDLSTGPCDRGVENARS